MRKVRSLIIPAAGIGSRLFPLTHIIPKEMIRLVDKPIFYYLVQEAYMAGIRHIIFIIHSRRTELEAFLKSEGGQFIYGDFPGVSFSFIKTRHRHGDGHAILQAKKIAEKEGVFAVSMGDLLSLPGTSLIDELKKVYERTREPVISVEQIDKSKTEQYGVIAPKRKTGRLYRVGSIIEKPKPANAPSNLIMTGKYILTTEIFRYIEMLIERLGGSEIKLAHALSAYAQEKTLNAYECRSKHYDTGVKADLLKTEMAFGLNHPAYGDILRDYLKKAPRS